MWALLRKKPGGPSSSPLESDSFLKLCEQNVRSIRVILDGGNLLNRRQCLDLSTKLSKIMQNIREVVAYSAAPNGLFFRPALQSLCRHLERARLLVSNCGGKDFCLGALSQNRNENAFREILLDVSLCYNAIYEQAKSTREDWNGCPEDLRQSLVFRPAEDSVIQEDQQDLLRRLEGIVRRTRTPTIFGSFLHGDHEQHLARYLLLRLKQSQFDTNSVMMLSKESEPSGAWGSSRFLGAGSGASGVVSTSWLGVRCAKKEYHDVGMESLFLKEAEILAHLNHPRVVKLFCCGNGSEKGDRFIAMELMQMTLDDLIQERKGVHFELPVAIDIMVQLARGICYLHDQGIAHRDINPLNIVTSRFSSPHLEDYFDVKLIDFGLSKIEVEASRSYTMTGWGIGSRCYRAPELLPEGNRGKANWFKADVFSFAMTCSHILSLQTPFKNIPVRVSYKEMKRGARPKLPGRCPKEVVALLMSCWDPNPNSRPSFMKIFTRLEAFSDKLLRQPSTLFTDEMNDTDDTSYNFIRSSIEEFSTIQRLSVGIPTIPAEGHPQDFPFEGSEEVFPNDGKDSLNKTNNGLGDESNDGFQDEFKDLSKTLDKMREDSLKKTEFYLDLSCLNLQIIENLVDGGSILNTRQCQDLSFKLSIIIKNIRALVLQPRGSIDLFLYSVKILYRYMEKAKLLVENCCSKASSTTSIFQIPNLFFPRARFDTWRRKNNNNKALCAVAAFQVHNENAFSEILHEVSLCYKAIYEQAKSVGHGMTEDLCLSNDLFMPPSSDDVYKDQEQIKKKLEDIANPYSSFGLLGPSFGTTEILMQSLARYLLMKLNFVNQESQIKPLDASNAIFWTLKNEPFIDEKVAWGSDKIIPRGSGAAGVVYTQWLGVPCVKKIFGDKHVDYFYGEGGMLIRLNHPRIIKFISCGNGEEFGDRFIAMESMDTSLGALIKDQRKIPFALPVALDIIVQIARGMRYIHDMGVTHRDLKPDNVVVKRLALQNLPDFFSVKVLDFGDSKAEIEASQSNIISRPGVGTSVYRAPEIHPKAHNPGDSGKAAWFKADVYSFAMTCVHILSLQSPFYEMEPYELSKKHMYCELIGGKRPELPEDCPQELTTLIKKCWHTDSTERPPFEEICIVLEGILFKFPREMTVNDRKVQLTSQADGDLKSKDFSVTNKYKKNDEVHDVLSHAEDVNLVEEDNIWKKTYDKYLTEFRNSDDEAKEAMYSELLESMLKLNKAELQNSKIRTQASSSSVSRPRGGMESISEEAHPESDFEN